MTWAKFGTEFFPRMRQRKLSDAARITHTEVIAYLYIVEQFDCVFDKDLLPAMAASKSRDAAAAELVACGYWRDHGDRWEVIDHAEVFRQSLAAQAKKLDRDRKAKLTYRSKGSADGSASTDDAGSGATDSQTDSPSGEGSHHVPGPREPEPWPDVKRAPLDLDAEQTRESWRRSAVGYDK